MKNKIKEKINNYLQIQCYYNNLILDLRNRDNPAYHYDILDQ